MKQSTPKRKWDLLNLAGFLLRGHTYRLQWKSIKTALMYYNILKEPV